MVFSALAIPAQAVAQTPVAVPPKVPPNLQALEQKMGELKVTSLRFSEQTSVTVPHGQSKILTPLVKAPALWASHGRAGDPRAGRILRICRESCADGTASEHAEQQYEQLEALVAEQAARIAKLEALIVELRQKLGQNSKNSSKPPSSDGLSKPPLKKGEKDHRERSLRKRSGRKPSGQEGHEGAHLQRVEVPDEEIGHDPEGPCEDCGRDLADGELLRARRRQVFDLPEEIDLRVVEHVARLRRCLGCGKETREPSRRASRHRSAMASGSRRWASICTSSSTSPTSAPA